LVTTTVSPALSEAISLASWGRTAGLAAELDAFGHRALAAFTSAFADQVTLETCR
jgi:hypothetical protein